MLAIEALGQIIEQAGDNGAALALYADQVAETRARHLDGPTDAIRRRDLAVALAAQGRCAHAVGDAITAQQCFTESWYLRRDLAAGSPDDVLAQSDLAWGHLHLGDLADSVGDQARAMREYEQSRRIRLALAGIQPDTPAAVRDLRAIDMRIERLAGLPERRPDRAVTAQLAGDLAARAEAAGRSGDHHTAYRLYREGLAAIADMVATDVDRYPRQRLVLLFMAVQFALALDEGEALDLAQELGEALVDRPPSDAERREFAADAASVLRQVAAWAPSGHADRVRHLADVLAGAGEGPG
jgi:tetratricopeptide (TPR) repeat protein